MFTHLRMWLFGTCYNMRWKWKNNRRKVMQIGGSCCCRWRHHLGPCRDNEGNEWKGNWEKAFASR